MTCGLRLLSVCVVAGLYGSASAAHAETIDFLRPTIAEDEVETDTVEVPVVVPSLTITPEEEQVTLRSPRAIADPYAAHGLGQGGVTLYPSLAAGTLYTSNASRAAANARSDMGLYLKPAMRFESDWIRHSWQGGASGDLTAYLKNDDLDTTQADVSSKFRLDIRHTTRAEFEAAYARNQTGSESSEVPDTAVGNRTDQALLASAAIIHDLGPLEGRAKLGLERQIYEDVELTGGGEEDNSDRNNYTPSLSLRLSYMDPPVLKPFVELTYAPRIHDEKFDRNGLRRNSNGLTASAGIVLDRGPIWSGEAALVYVVRDSDDPALANNEAIGVSGNLTWRPTDLTSVVLTVETKLNESSSPTSSGTKTWSGGIDVSHELRENVNLLGGLELEIEKFSGGTDTTITSSFGLEWQLNPNLAWTAGYDGTWFEAASSGGNYNDQRVVTGIVLRQ